MRTLILVLALAGCVQPRPPRNVDLTFHADADFSLEQKRDLQDAARLWTAYTGNKARIHVVFDVLDPFQSLLSHVAQGHQVIRRVDDYTALSRAIDEVTNHGDDRTRTLAVTHVGADRRQHVFFIDQRIPREHFFSIAAHEFGHVLGFPDLTQPDCIMSGIHGKATNWPTSYDRQLCKAAKYCDE